MLTEKQINLLNKCVEGKWSFNRKTGLVNVNGNFLLHGGWKNLRGIHFGYVTGHFNCSNNKLTSLEGSLIKVGGNFNCSLNKLTSLKGVPAEVGGDFNCSNNNLTSLEGAPSKVGGNFDCRGNKLTSLKGAPTKIKSVFYCFGNNLTSLKGIPSSVGCFSSDFFYFDKGFDRFTQKTLVDIYLGKLPIWGIRIAIPSLPFLGIRIELNNETRNIIRNSFTKKTLDKYTFIDF